MIKINSNVFNIIYKIYNTKNIFPKAKVLFKKK